METPGEATGPSVHEPRERVQRLFERIEHELRGHRAGDPPADDAACEDVDDEGDVHEARPGRHVSEVGEPQLGRPLGSELTLDTIGRPIGLIRRNRGAAAAAPYDAPQAQPAHQSFDRAAGHRAALTTQLLPDLAHAIDPEVLVPDPLDRGTELGVAHRPGRQPPRIGLAGLVLVVRRRGDRQLGTDQLDPVLGAVCVDCSATMILAG